MRRIIWIAAFVVALAFWCVDYQSSLEESDYWLSPERSVIDYEEEMDVFYKRAVEENANETPFKTKERYADDKNSLVVGILDDFHCMERDRNNVECVFFFEDGCEYSVRFSKDMGKKLFPKYDFSSPIGFHLVPGGGGGGYGRNLIISSRYEVADK